MAVLGLRCRAWAFSSCGEKGLLFVAVHGLLIAVASLVVEHGLQAHGFQQLWHVGSVVVAHRLQSAGSVVVAHGLSCSVARGIFPGLGLEPMSPALAGRSLTTVPPGKSPSIMLAVDYFEDTFYQVKGVLFYSKFAESFFVFCFLIMNEGWVL